MVQEILPFRVPKIIQAAFLAEAFMEKIKKKLSTELYVLLRKPAKESFSA